jgi:hypothetical protein
MLLLVCIGVATWLSVLVFVVALCAMASRSDDDAATEAAEARLVAAMTPAPVSSEDLAAQALAEADALEAQVFPETPAPAERFRVG